MVDRVVVSEPDREGQRALPQAFPRARRPISTDCCSSIAEESDPSLGGQAAARRSQDHARLVALSHLSLSAPRRSASASPAMAADRALSPQAIAVDPRGARQRLRARDAAPQPHDGDADDRDLRRSVPRPARHRRRRHDHVRGDRRQRRRQRQRDRARHRGRAGRDRRRPRRRDPGAVWLQLPDHPHQGRDQRHAGLRRRVRDARWPSPIDSGPDRADQAWRRSNADASPVRQTSRTTTSTSRRCSISLTCCW